MSQPQNGRDMDRPSTAGGSVKRARELAEGGLGKGQLSADQSLDPARRPAGASTAGQSRPPRPPALAGLQKKDGIGASISRPKPVPQWPLAGPIPSPTGSGESDKYRPPPGRSQPPERPPRPSRVPSILDGSRVQDHTPVFQYKPQPERDSGEQSSSMPQTPASAGQTSSMGSIPDFPVPVAAPPPPTGPPRRSVNLGPPPSSRRGASSFYSNASFVSPIPEESPRSRSHVSLASSAAMPESWGTPSPGPSPAYPEVYYEDTITEEGSGSMYDDDGDGDESRLVRSASMGKRAKPALVMTKGAPSAASTSGRDENREAVVMRPGPKPIQGEGPFADGTGYVEGSSSMSSSGPSLKATAGPPVPTTDAMLNALAAARASDTTDGSRTSPSPRPFSRLSAIRRPPRLDIETGKDVQARSSMTSLPDLIKRATRLAAMIDKGRRPASRFDDFGEYADEKAGRDGDRELSTDDRYQSGLSDMLAAFPPPVQTRRQSRGSWFRNAAAWPLAPTSSRDRQPPNQAQTMKEDGLARSLNSDDRSSNRRRWGRRRCFGIPLWAFLLIVVVVLGVVAAAILVPLEFFVLRKNATSATAQCKAKLKCANGGTNVVTDGVCSCICTNGFTGSSCTVAGQAGCTTTNLVFMGTTSSATGTTRFNNVTLGQAIPRLIQEAQSNFSIPLQADTILAKFNTDNLSCLGQNALVTFDGQAQRIGAANNEVTGTTDGLDDGSDGTDEAFAPVAGVKDVEFASISAITIVPPTPTTLVIDVVETTVLTNSFGQVIGGFSTIPFSVSTIFATTFRTTLSLEPTAASVPPPPPPPPPPATATATATETSTSTEAATGAATATATMPPPTTTFTVTQEVLDFARVAMLFIIQQEGVTQATTAQTSLQRFLSSASEGSTVDDSSSTVSVGQAMNVTLGGRNSVNLVQFTVDVGSGAVGGKTTSLNRKRSLLGVELHPHFRRLANPP